MPREAQASQEDQRRAQNALNKCDIFSGRRIVGVRLVSGTPTTIDHGLGRAIQGWFVCRGNYDGSGNWASYAEYPSTVDNTRQFVMWSSLNALVDLWVF